MDSRLQTCETYLLHHPRSSSAPPRSSQDPNGKGPMASLSPSPPLTSPALSPHPSPAPTPLIPLPPFKNRLHMTPSSFLLIPHPHPHHTLNRNNLNLLLAPPPLLLNPLPRILRPLPQILPVSSPHHHLLHPLHLLLLLRPLPSSLPACLELLRRHTNAGRRKFRSLDPPPLPSSLHPSSHWMNKELFQRLIRVE